MTCALLLPDAAQAEMTDFPKVRLRSLDKITARTMTFDARVGTTIKFGSIYIKILACQKPDLQERPEAASFLQIWEITPDDVSKWIFSGWMFASSPAVSAMDHPIYDVWVIDCLDEPGQKAKEETVDDDKDETPPAAVEAEKPAETAEKSENPETPETPLQPEKSDDTTPAPTEAAPESVPATSAPDIGDVLNKALTTPGDGE